VNPIALRRIEKLFCKNERAVIETRLSNRDLLTLVPVAAILVASIRLNCVDAPLNLAYRGPNLIPCTGHYEKGDEMGWFEHGSTIVVLAPRAWSFAESVDLGKVIRMGQPLFRMPAPWRTARHGAACAE
jgi:phosphatidylserine decarboxylase